MAPDHRSGERSQELHLLHRSQGRHGLRGHRRYDAMHRGALRPQVGDPGALACIYTRASCSCPSCPTDNYIGARATLFHAPRAEGGACARGAWPFSLGEAADNLWRRATPGIATLFFATGRLQVSVHMGTALGHLDHISHELDSGTRKEICLFLV